MYFSLYHLETPDEIGMSSVLLDEVDEMYLNSFLLWI